MKNHTGQDPFSSDSLYSIRVENSQRPCFTGCKENLKYYVLKTPCYFSLGAGKEKELIQKQR